MNLPQEIELIINNEKEEILLKKMKKSAYNKKYREKNKEKLNSDCLRRYYDTINDIEKKKYLLERIRRSNLEKNKNIVKKPIGRPKKYDI
jgi:hypothetical protein